jgi:uncharacterized membrane protein (UPF0136 family)
MDIRTISRAAGAAALVIGPVASAAPIVVTDSENGTAAEQLADYAANSGAAQASNVLLLLIIAVVPAMIYAARLARPGAPKLAFAGGALAALGWLAGLIGIGAGQIALYQGSRLDDRAAAAALIDGVYADPVYGSLVGVFVIGHIAGMILLGVALWRSRAVPSWAAGLFIAYPVLHFIAHVTTPAIDWAAKVAFVVSAVVIAMRVLRTSNDRWDLPAGTGAPVPQRPVAAAA